MLFKNSIAALTGLVAAVHATPVDLAERQASCPGEITQVVISTQVVAYPVVINQYFGDNTVINIEGGVTININNAPTSLVTTGM